MMKAMTRVNAPLDALIENAINFKVRALWDKVLYDFRVFEMTSDRTASRVYYSFKSPMGVTDRDFYLQQLVRYDSPRPGCVSMHISSLPPDDGEMPQIPKRVRATMHIVGFIMEPKVDAVTREDYCDVFMLTSVDINGLVPKWIVNMGSSSVPRSWFK